MGIRERNHNGFKNVKAIRCLCENFDAVVTKTVSGISEDTKNKSATEEKQSDVYKLNEASKFFEQVKLNKLFSQSSRNNPKHQAKSQPQTNRYPRSGNESRGKQIARRIRRQLQVL